MGVMSINVGQDAIFEQKLDRMKKQIVDAGGWTAREAALFVLSASIDKDAGALETIRQQRSAKLKADFMAMDGIDFASGGDQAAADRARCRLGLDTIASALELRQVTGDAWRLLESKIAKVAGDMKIALKNSTGWP